LLTTDDPELSISGVDGQPTKSLMAHMMTGEYTPRVFLVPGSREVRLYYRGEQISAGVTLRIDVVAKHIYVAKFSLRGYEPFLWIEDAGDPSITFGDKPGDT
jgi:hypothetical protein